MLLTQKVAFNSPVWFNVGCDRLEPESDGQNWHWDPATGGVQLCRDRLSQSAVLGLLHQFRRRFAGLDSDPGQDRRHAVQVGLGNGNQPVIHPRLAWNCFRAAVRPPARLSFMRGFDAFAGVIKSGGKTRRAAKMVILNVDHPDIMEFIDCKAKEEAKAFTLIKAGYDGSGPDSEAYSSIFFQNANNSVRVSDEFMRAYESDGEFTTYTVKSHEPVKTYKARDIMRKIAEATWLCGDPGMQFDTTINRWHTSKNTARINASNPCSEYMFLDNSACNLASFNLMKFVTPTGTFDIPAYRHAISVVITAMEILVDNSGYPTEAISRNSHDYRPLGLGYANLGALLMAMGLPYDSTAGRDMAGVLTAIMCGQAYLQSAVVAAQCPPIASATPLTAGVERQGGACPGFYVNREPFLDVIRMHRAEVNNIGKSRVSGEPFNVPQLDALIDASRECWDMALRLRRALRLPQLADHGAGADWHHRLHDGLRYHRHRAGPCAGQVQEAGRRRHDQDRQQHRARGSLQAGLQQRPGERDRQLHRRDRHHRRRAGHQAGASRGVRLQLQAGQGHALHSIHGAHQDDGGGAAVPVRSHFEDREPASRGDRGRCGRGLRRELASGHQGRGHLSRRIKGYAAAEHQHGCKDASLRLSMLQAAGFWRSWPPAMPRPKRT